MPTRVYVVDDDALVTTSLGMALRLETDWEVVVYNDAAVALAEVAARPPDVVLSDLKMPRMDGIALLKAVRARVPDAVLLLLTGYADKESAIEAINAVGLWQYVEKPWDTTDLILKVGQGLERRDLARDLKRTNVELADRLVELERAREQLLRGERLAAVGRVMSGLAHEMGNQLALLGYAELIADRATDPDIIDYARHILAGQKRLATMIAEIKDFARGGEAGYAREPGDLATVVDETVSILRFDRDVCEVRLAVEVAARPLVRFHRGKLVQVLLNLVRNAAQASPAGSEVTIALDEAGDEARLSVIDHGAGMSDETLSRLGEPFYTTKEGGTGLGLGISRRIVTEHGGRLDYRSAQGEGHGTEARITLPRLAIVAP